MDLYETRKALNGGKTIYELPLKVTYYARVSTEKEEQLHSLTAQIRYYRDLILSCEKWEYTEGYVDEGISGTSVKKRERFLQMIEDARNGKFDFIITKEISRFSRNTLDSIRYTQELLQYGVGVLFQSDNINTLLPDAELRLTIMSSVAQEEVRKISERVKFGFRRAIEKGVVLGSNRIWGYEKQGGRLVIHEEEAQVVRSIFDLYANERLGIRTIAARLSEQGIRNSNGRPMSFSTIRGILENPKYKGYYCGGKSTRIDYKMRTVKNFTPEEWVMYEDHEHVPPIVSEELWEKAQGVLEERRAKQSSGRGASQGKQYPFSGKIFCGVHNEVCYRGLYRYKKEEKEVWRCKKYVEGGRSECNAPILYTYEIEMVMRDIVDKIFPDRSGWVTDLLRIYGAAASDGPARASLRKSEGALEEIQRRKDRLLDLNISGRVTDDEFMARNERLNQDAVRLQAQIRKLKKQSENEGEKPPEEGLRAAAEGELRLERDLTAGVVEALLERAVIFGTAEKNCIELHILLKGASEELLYRIHRQRGKPSVCTGPYI